MYTNNNNTQQTIPMTQPNPQLPTLSTPSVTRVEQSTKAKRKHITKNHKSMFNTTEPAHNKKYRTQEAETTPAGRTRAYTQLTRMENKTHKGQVPKSKITIAQLRNDVHQALAVMDTDTGKLLNYRQLMRNPKYKNNWST